MSKITYEVASASATEFAKALVLLGAVGAEPEVAYKGNLLRARVHVPSDAVIPKLHCIRQAPVQTAPEVVEQRVVEVKIEEGKVYTREELEAMSAGQLKKATGLQGRRADVIAEYLENVKAE